MPELPAYTVAAVAAPLLVIALELLVLRTGLFRTAQYWLALAIVLGFQLPVNGWLSKPHGRIVHYDEQVITGVRVMWFPVEDYGFGFALVTLTMLLWRRLRARTVARPLTPGTPAARRSVAAERAERRHSRGSRSRPRDPSR